MTMAEPEPVSKEKLLSRLLEGVKGCQSRFGSRTELATEDDDSVKRLCIAFEDVFLHGVKREEKKGGLWGQVTENLVPAGLRLPTESPSFWPLVKSQLSKHEAERFLLLHNVRSDYGRARSWLRSALNEHSLERYIHIFLSTPESLSNLYEKWAFLRDPELSSILPQTAAGLGSILFALVVDNPVLDCWVRNVISEDAVASPVEVAEVADQFLAATTCGDSISSPDTSSSAVDFAVLPRNQRHVSSSSSSSKHASKKKKPHVNVVSFDDDEGMASSSKPSSRKVSSSQSSTIGDTDSNRTTPAPTSAFTSPELENETAVQNIPISPSSSEIPEISVYSSSVKSADCISVNSVYSDCSERLDIDSIIAGGSPQTQNLLAGRISPSQRLKPCREGRQEEEENSQGDCSSGDLNLIPMPNCDPDEVYGRPPPELHIDLDFSPSTPTPSLMTPTNPVTPSTESETISKLKTVLDREIENVATLQADLAEERRKSRDQLKILEAKVESLTKENEILRHQLNKYIGAVQLLKSGRKRMKKGTSFEDEEDDDEELQQEIEHLSTELERKTQEEEEGADYERKLIQVAEMHGELMEFNGHLQTALRKRDLLIKRLKEELESLRGPLSYLGGPADDNGTTAGIFGFDEGSWDIVDSNSGGGTGQGVSPSGRRIHVHHNERVLINIWIPSAFLTGAANDLHHVYQVFIRIKDTEWNVYRRYSQFYSFHRDLKKKDPVIGSFYFPPKKHVGNKDVKFVEERRRKLQDYLRLVINHTLQTHSVIAAHPDKNLLISLFPFFGEHTLPHHHRNPKKEKSKKNLFFRNSSSQNQQNNAASHSPSGLLTQQVPQYTGL